MKRPGQSRLKVVPCSFKQANEFVMNYHRHHGPVRGHKFSVACADESGETRGVAVVGRPVARNLDDGTALEVTRMAVLDESPNACSFLYAASWRAAKALGYSSICTYILSSESGASLKAAGWVKVADVLGRSWSCPSRPRYDKHPTEDKTRWMPAECVASLSLS